MLIGLAALYTVGTVVFIHQRAILLSVACAFLAVVFLLAGLHTPQPIRP